jgi:type I restriction enzyme S subunit
LDGVERCIDDELPFEIPESWQWVRVRDCTALFNGRAFKPSDWTATGLPIVRIQNLNDEKALFNYFDKPVDEDVHLYGGELLFAWSGTPGTSFGAHIWRDEEAVLNQHIFKLLFDETAIFKPYYMYALNQRVGSLIKAAHGSAGLQHVTRGVFEATLVPLPPLAEQHRIVQRIEELLPMVQGL